MAKFILPLVTEAQAHVQDGMHYEEAQALPAEGFDPDDPADIAAVDLVQVTPTKSALSARMSALSARPASPPIFAAARRPISTTVRATRTTARPRNPVNRTASNPTPAPMSHCSVSVLVLSSSTNCNTVVCSTTYRNAVDKRVDLR